ncbi:MAG: tetraacyldisaccharide 4'-kinase, partial [Planctomycetota bacterium]
MSGQKRGWMGTCVRAGLRIAAIPYGWAVCLRNRQYDRGSKPVHRCGVPVISVGNLTTGGTGKTPIVCAIAERLRASDRRVALVSRGYGRGGADQNDEAEELFARLPDVPHLQDPDRVESARIAVEELETELILMDDGFQHRRLHRDLDIVVIDATCPFGFGHVLPRGLLREPLSGIRRSDLIVISRCGLVAEATVQGILNRLARLDQRVGDDIPVVLS